MYFTPPCILAKSTKPFFRMAACRANQPQSWILFDNAANRYALKAPIEEIVKGRCDTRCQHWLQHVVSFHLRGRSHSSFLRAAAVMYALTESHHAAMQYIDMAQGLEKDIAAGFRAEPDKDL